MTKRILSISLAMLAFVSALAGPSRKIIDDGGSGPFKAEAVSDPSLDNYVVYRPADYKAAVKAEGPLPLLVFANGGCNDTSLPHERMLNDIASHGYLVVALGQMQDSINDREPGQVAQCRYASCHRLGRAAEFRSVEFLLQGHRP